MAASGLDTACDGFPLLHWSREEKQLVLAANQANHAEHVPSVRHAR